MINKDEDYQKTILKAFYKAEYKNSKITIKPIKNRRDSMSSKEGKNQKMYNILPKLPS